MPAADSAERIRALLAFFRATHYDVALPDDRKVTIRTGTRPAPEIADWIGADAFGVYMTACNPYSQELSDAENERRLDELRTKLCDLGCRFLEGAGHVPGERWREPSLLACGLDIAGVDRLATVYEQNAVLLVHPGEPSRMRIYRADWRRFVEEALDIEWASPHESAQPE